MQKKKFSLTQLIFMALMAAVMCIAGPLAVPIGPVPITLTNLVIYIAVGVLGTAQGTISYCLYLLLGMVGLPVFSGYAGGLGKLAGPTGGYLIGFIAMALIGGIVMEVSHRKLIPTLIGCLSEQPLIICLEHCGLCISCTRHLCRLWQRVFFRLLSVTV